MKTKDGFSLPQERMVASRLSVGDHVLKLLYLRS